MGKDNLKERRKKNVKGPSSSAAAAELASKGGFMDAFARFKAGGIISHDATSSTSTSSSSSTSSVTSPMDDSPILASFDAVRFSQRLWDWTQQSRFIFSHVGERKNEQNKKLTR